MSFLLYFTLNSFERCYKDRPFMKASYYPDYRIFISFISSIEKSFIIGPYKTHYWHWVLHSGWKDFICSTDSPDFNYRNYCLLFFLLTTEEFQTHMVLCHFNEIESSKNWVTLDYFPSIVTTLPLHYPLTHPSKIILSFITQLLGNSITSD